MNAQKLILACLGCLLLAAPAVAAPQPTAQPTAQPAAEAPANDVFGVSLLSPAGDCQPPKAVAGSVDPTQKCGYCSQDGCKLNWIGVECGTTPHGPKYCEVTTTATCIDGGAICRCLVP